MAFARACLGVKSLQPQVHVQKRFLSLLEYQSKKILEDHGLRVQAFRVADKLEDLDSISKSFVAEEYVIKAQILAGGRGKGTFDNGFKGGVHITKDPSQIPDIVKKMLGHRLVTKQTPSDGILVNHVMVADSIDITKETYLSIILDRSYNGPVIIASPSGGVDIEEVAESTPDKVLKMPINIEKGVTKEVGEKVAKFLEFEGNSLQQATVQIEKLWKLFMNVDATQIEINPLADSTRGVYCVDAKLQFDDNAQFRQKGIFSLEDATEADPRELEATKHNLNYIGMEGNIGCLVNGAGLAMATMDIIKLHGGQPANFLDVGGNVKEDQVLEAFKILTLDSTVKAILVNVFGGIVNCATIANGIVRACESISLQVPLIVRLEGTNVEEARSILSSSGLAILTASDLDDAAQKAVGCVS